jgi:uncharacterized repeat protein (TIGR03837 family)
MERILPSQPAQCGSDNRRMRWDVFCRVIDNHGDLGVCWRLAADLAARGEQVRLWVDDASALRWMAPGGCPGVEALPWREPSPDEEPGDVVVEAFGCDPPTQFVARMAASAHRPIWVNLEYLSAEDYVERSHGLPSPQFSGPGRGLTKWFFYPGFTRSTGGLLREPGLEARRSNFDPQAWRVQGWPSTVDRQARVISLFCYDNPALPALLDSLRQAPTKLFVTPGPAARQVAAWLGHEAHPGQHFQRGEMGLWFLPWLTQPQYDELLWSCDLNFVRGEDSLVRALWAAKPFVWQLYPQADAAHLAKLAAFLRLYLAPATPALQAAVGAAFDGWNRGAALKLPALGATSEWAALARLQQQSLLGATDLTAELCRFVAEKR